MITGAQGALRECDGQMVVELAVAMPVLLVVALIVLNLMMFLEACARFDRVVPDIIMAVAVSPSNAGAHQEHALVEAISSALEGLSRVEVAVRAEGSWSGGSADPGFSFAPHLVRYVCTLTYRPWPSGISVGGIDAGVPPSLEHERSFTVDRYRGAVVF